MCIAGIGASVLDPQEKISCMSMHVSCMIPHGMHGATLQDMQDHACFMPDDLE